MKINKFCLIALATIISTSALAQTHAPQELYTTSLYSDPSLVAYWRMEGNSSDSKGIYTGSDNSITYGNSYGKFGQGASFNGSNAWINMGSALLESHAIGSISFWTYPTANGRVFDAEYPWQYTTFFAKGQTLNAILQLTNNKVRVYYYDGSYRYFDSNSVLTLNAWHLITLTWDGNGSALYVDGASDATSSLTFTNSVSNAVKNFYIGAQNGIANYCTYQGYLDDFAIFNRVLTAAEVANLYKGPSHANAIFFGTGF